MMDINPDMDMIVTFFPWNDCRLYHQSTISNFDWMTVVRNTIPVDCDYLIRATYTDAVTIISEYLLYAVQGDEYWPSISFEYLKFVLAKNQTENTQHPYYSLLAQVFLTYKGLFQHEELFLQLLKANELKEVNLEILSNIFKDVIDILESRISQLAESDSTSKEDFFETIINNSVPFTQEPFSHVDGMDDGVFNLTVRKRRRNPWGSCSSMIVKKGKMNEEPNTPYYPMPEGNLPLLSRAASLILSDEFHLEKDSFTSKSTSSGISTKDTEGCSMNNGIVQRRQKIKRKRFRLVFYDDSFQSSTIPLESASVPFNPYDFDENNPAIRKSTYFALKGVVPITSTRFRVQLNAFKHEKKKFSRNTSDLNEALWIFEVCLLISDAPASLSQLLRIGNYYSLIQLPPEFKFFRNPIEYFVELGKQILLFSYSDDVFSRTLLKIAIENLENLSLNAIANEEMLKTFERNGNLHSNHTEKSGNEPNFQEIFTKNILQLFHVGKSMKHEKFEFSKIFARCPQTPVPPKIYMSKEE